MPDPRAQTKPWTVRRLLAADAAIDHALRLGGVTRHPLEFRVAPDDEPGLTSPAAAEFLEGTFVAGVFDGNEDAWHHMGVLAGHWQLPGCGRWAVEKRPTRAFVGRVGLHFPEGWPDREVAWPLASRFWGRGYAAEAARGALHVRRWPA